jgi:hypothetical protein
MPNTERQCRVTVTVDGVSLGSQWEDRTGGESTSTPQRHFLGGMGPEIILSAKTSLSDVVVTKIQDDELRARKKWLRTRVGPGLIVIAGQWTDDEGNAVDDPEVWSGRLTYFKGPDVKAQSDAPAMVELHAAVALVA